jgi:hypothetical protein
VYKRQPQTPNPKPQTPIIKRGLRFKAKKIHRKFG